MRRDSHLVDDGLVVVKALHEAVRVLHHVLGDLPRVFLLRGELASLSDSCKTVVDIWDTDVEIDHSEETNSDIARWGVKCFQGIEILLLKTLESRFGFLDQRFGCIQIALHGQKESIDTVSDLVGLVRLNLGLISLFIDDLLLGTDNSSLFVGLLLELFNLDGFDEELLLDNSDSSFGVHQFSDSNLELSLLVIQVGHLLLKH